MIEDTLKERGESYGDFSTQAQYAQGFKSIAMRSPNWNAKVMADDQREALDMIFNKISRILNGDPNFHDSWHDIVGYAKLVADRLASD